VIIRTHRWWKGKARGLKPPLDPIRGGLALPQNQNSEIILLGVGLKIAKKIDIL